MNDRSRRGSRGRVEDCREFVEAYVEFVHYVERLHQDVVNPAHPGAEPGAAAGHAAHEHDE